MAKRHHQSMHARKDEAYGEGFYEGAHERRRQEMEDGGMIREDKSAIANMPQEVMIKMYPKAGPYMPEELDDTIRGVDMQMDKDNSQRARMNRPHKY